MDDIKKEERRGRIAGYRTMAGFTQEEMAAKLGLSVQSYNQKENGYSGRRFYEDEMSDFKRAVQERVEGVTMDAIFFA